MEHIRILNKNTENKKKKKSKFPNLRRHVEKQGPLALKPRANIPSLPAFTITHLKILQNDNIQALMLVCLARKSEARGSGGWDGEKRRDSFQKRIEPIRKNCKSFQTVWRLALLHTPNLSLFLSFTQMGVIHNRFYIYRKQTEIFSMSTFQAGYI